MTPGHDGLGRDDEHAIDAHVFGDRPTHALRVIHEDGERDLRRGAPELKLPEAIRRMIECIPGSAS